MPWPKTPGVADLLPRLLRTAQDYRIDSSDFVLLPYIGVCALRLRIVSRLDAAVRPLHPPPQPSCLQPVLSATAMTDLPLPPAADAANALDAQALARLRELDPEGRSGVVGRVMQAFETSLVRQLAQLIEARDTGDTAAIGHLAHTLKSSSASLGALALSACCAEVEQAVRAGETDALAPQVDQLLSLAQGALAAVRAMLRDQPPRS